MLSDFYRSKEWETLRDLIKLERTDRRGRLICEHCHKPIVKSYDCIAHHKIYLTEENYIDSSISLNPQNIALVHHKCHNIIHNKLGYSDRKVFVVYGSPFSGKNSYVDSIKQNGDLIVDIDNIWACISGEDKYIKPNRLKSIVFNIYNSLIDIVRVRQGKWQSAYVIGGFPLIGERERLCNQLGAVEIFIDTSKEECLQRLNDCNDERKNKKEQWKQYIDDWWDKYTPHPY